MNVISFLSLIFLVSGFVKCSPCSYIKCDCQTLNQDGSPSDEVNNPIQKPPQGNNPPLNEQGDSQRYSQNIEPNNFTVNSTIPKEKPLIPNKESKKNGKLLNPSDKS